MRSVVLRTTGLPETATIDVVFDLHAKPAGMTRQQFQAVIEGTTHRRQSTALAELANVAAFVASDRANAMTGTVANLTGGAIVDRMPEDRVILGSGTTTDCRSTFRTRARERRELRSS